jgi:hypothetical protein
MDVTMYYHSIILLYILYYFWEGYASQVLRPSIKAYNGDELFIEAGSSLINDIHKLKHFCLFLNITLAICKVFIFQRKAWS